ncbi:S-adenosyl-L-methionine-dependent methyltransferase [Sordaria brevicollis]|uniref:S-adenosyl-L-methionine-dependent methyltransferase n=1 Tax=Sordaria brevicollis TaxID=83679 RepID=A0AAE0PIN2_SORBR|nr:S-adenosyl-L-methionine-dependent methyltransferase [Sordaria brevicollis]
MSSPTKSAQSPVREATSPTVQSPKGKAKSPTPGPASPPAAQADAPTDLLSASHWGELELPEDDDSTLGSDAESSTASISSSIMHYRTISGRTYHSDSVSDSEYWGPNDAKAMEVMDVFHTAMTLILDERLYTAPLPKDIKNVLDVGTGTGLWAIDFADENPNCNVIGTDISPIQPSWVPPNLSFNIDDATKEWTYQPDFFDYIHIRWLCGTIKDWPALYKEAYKCLKPGGWIEHMDGDVNMVCLDGTMPKDSAIYQWGQLWCEIERKTGVVFNIVDSGCMENGIKEAGFTNIQIENFLAPTAPWPTDEKQKQIGLYQYVSLTSDVEGFLTYFFGQVMGWTDNEMAKYAAALRREYKECKVHANINWRVVRAQKPLDA